MKLTREDFNMIKEAINIYYENLWNKTMEIMTSESMVNVNSNSIDEFWKKQEQEIKKWYDLKEKLK